MNVSKKKSAVFVVGKKPTRLTGTIKESRIERVSVESLKRDKEKEKGEEQKQADQKRKEELKGLEQLKHFKYLETLDGEETKKIRSKILRD